MYIWLKKAIKSVALAGLVLLACSPVAKAESQRTYRIATVAWMGWSPLHVACENGYWTRQGIKVQVVDYDDPTVILEAMKAGMIDFAMDMVGSLVGLYLKGVPLVVLAETDWSHGGDKIVVRSDTDLHALVGQPVGVFLNLPSSLFFLDQYLKEQKLRLDQFRIVEIRAQDLAAQFAAGRIKAMVLYEPWAALVQSQTRARVVATSADYTGCIPEGIWGYRDRVLDIPAEDIEKILRGWVDAAVWVNDPANWEAYAGILNKRTFAGHQQYTGKALKEMFNNVRIHDRAFLLERNKNNGGMEKYLEVLKNFLKTNGLLTKDFQPHEIFDNRFILSVLQSYQK